MSKGTLPWTVLSIFGARLRVDQRTLTVVPLLLVVVGALSFISLSYGDYRLSFPTLVKALFGYGDATSDMVIWEWRLPRILLAVCVGMALAVSGAILQGVTHNALADPGIIGINQGAAVAVVLGLVWFADLPITVLPWLAFLGGTVAALVIYLLAWKGGSSPIRLILVGIGFAAFALSLTTSMVVFGDVERVEQAFVWLAGSIYGRDWQAVYALAMWLLILLPVAFCLSPTLNVLLQGDATVLSLGVRVEVMRLVLIFISVALASAAVAVAGVFGFVGLVAPHLARQLVGSAYQGLIPTAALVGAGLLVAADLIGRSVIAPSQIPAGLVSAIIGAPYFFWQMRRHYRNEQLT